MSLREKWAELGTGAKVLVALVVVFGLVLVLVVGLIILLAIIGSFVVGVGSEEGVVQAFQALGSLLATGHLVAPEAVA